MFWKNKKIYFYSLAIIGVFAVFGLGIWVGGERVVCKVCAPEQVDFSLFWEAWNTLGQKYIRNGELNTQNMIYGAISGMVRSLEDPYTEFFNPQDTKTFVNDTSGRFEGVGMEVGLKNNQLQVVAPLEGTPADQAGIRAGDKILKIDSAVTTDMTVEKAISLIRGQKGTEVTLLIMRNGWSAPKEFKIVRALIEVPSTKWKIIDYSGIENSQGEVAYIKISQFSDMASGDFSRVAFSVLNGPAKKIILDLRNNPGGYLDAAQQISEWFLSKGQTIVIEDFNNKQERTDFKARNNGSLLPYPAVVLINQGSASASEILAAALRDNRGVKLVGETSFGKGSVQELASLTGGSALKITIADWLTPKEARITGVGLEPDVKVELTEEDYQNDKDPQLDKALEILKALQ